MNFLKKVKITRCEERRKDAWFDLSLRQIRQGQVRFYRVQDFLTGNWLFKICQDKELRKVVVKAVKCPPGIRFVQLEGATMLFQKSIIDDLLYDVISLTYADENERLHRKTVKSRDEIPVLIREHFRIRSYDEAAGKKAPGKYWVTLSERTNEKEMIALFLIERAWPLSPVSFEERVQTIDLLALVKALAKTSIEEIYQKARVQFGIDGQEVEIILDTLAREGRIRRLAEDYVKITE